jgi:hypothetical protein
VSQSEQPVPMILREVKFRQWLVEHGHVFLQPPVQSCAACKQYFKAGDVYALMPLGPGPDPEQRVNCSSGMPYHAVAVPVHWACATGFDS